MLAWRGEVGDVDQSVYVSQRDVRELQFAKAAIATGWALLLEELGVEAGDVQQVLLAGSFGSYLSPGNAVRIGLVPKLPVLRIVSAGNVAGEGAKMVLLSAQERAGADALLREVHYVELSDRPEFNDRFVDQLAFPGLTHPAVIACGALAQGVADIAALALAGRRAPAAAAAAQPTPPHRRRGRATGRRVSVRYDHVVVGYADCGTYGALDEVCDRLGLERLAGLHCYDVYGGAERLARWFEEQPGTYVFTDFLVRSFARTVLTELGLDRHPELRDAYFGHYTQAVWLAEWPTADLRRRADEAAAAIGLPLRVVDVGDAGLESALEQVLRGS